jgi:hypothetical protein
VLKAVLALIGGGGLLVAAHVALGSDLFLSPVRIALLVALPAAIGCAALLLLLARPATQLVALICAAAALLAVFAAELLREIEATRADHRGWTPWTRTDDVPYPPVCGKYVMVMEPDGSVRSTLRSLGQEIQPVGGIADNPLGGGLSSDEHGFISPPGEWARAAGGIMAIGDSFTAGADVDPGRGFVDLLRNRLGPLVNLGCSWNGPLIELAALVEYGPVVRPRTVLWFFYEGNDLTDLELELRSPLLRRYLEPGFTQALARQPDVLAGLLRAYVDQRVQRVPPTDAAARPLEFVIYGDNPRGPRPIDWNHVLTLQNLRWGQGLLDLPERRDTLDRLGEVLARAQGVARGWGGEIVLVYLPGRQRLATRLARIESEAVRGPVLRIVEALGLPVVDLTPEFELDPRPSRLFDAHYSEEGNALVADTVAAALRRPRQGGEL